MPSVPGYIYAQKDNDLYVNLFIQSSTDIELQNTTVGIEQETKYPWDGAIKITVSPKEKSNFTVKVRIPGWSVNQPLPGDLYYYPEKTEKKPTISINDENVEYSVEGGYAVLNREWIDGDEITLLLPMDVKKVKANDLVEDDKGKVAIERGPIVYCVEEVDNPQIEEITVSKNTAFTTDFNPDLLAGIEIIKASGKNKSENFKAIPYFVWNNRGANKMDVWLKED